MPFLHHSKKRDPSFKRADESTRRNGWRCKIFRPAGGYYKGNWQGNLQSGKGLQLLPSGFQYEGDWLCNKKNGFGVLSKYDEETRSFHLVYLGDYINNKKHGHGSLHRKDGSFYEGQFKNDKYHGFGRCWFPDGSYYEGCWANGVQEGHGLFVQANGNRYEGEWHNGKKDGIGEFYHLGTSQKQTGLWKNEICISGKIEDIKFRQSALSPTPYPIQECMLNPKAPIILFLGHVENTIDDHHRDDTFLDNCHKKHEESKLLVRFT